MEEASRTDPDGTRTTIQASVKPILCMVPEHDVVDAHVAIDPLDVLSAMRQRHPVLVICTFRGDWCRFCQLWLERWSAVPGFEENLREKRAHVLFVSSQNYEQLVEVGQRLGLLREKYATSITFVSDAAFKLTRWMDEELGVRVPLLPLPEHLARRHGSPEAIQSAVVAFRSEDQHVLFRWWCNPSVWNMHGTIGRPDPVHIWKNIMHSLEVCHKEDQCRARCNHCTSMETDLWWLQGRSRYLDHLIDFFSVRSVKQE